MKGLLALLLLLSNVSVACADIYTWKDARGTVFYTNSLNEIPARYLRKARVLDVATGKKGGLATAQPAVPAAPGTPAVQTQVQPAPAANTAGSSPTGGASFASYPAPPAPSASPASSAPPALGAAMPQPRESRAQRKARARHTAED
jgi:hypothetical protein